MKSDDVTITISFVGQDIDLKRQLEIDEADLRLELAHQPVWYAYYAGMLTTLKTDLEEKASAFEKKKADLAHEHRERLTREGRKVTEKMLIDAVASDDRLDVWRRDILNKKRAIGMLTVAEKSFGQRLEVLKALAFLENNQRSVPQEEGVRHNSGREVFASSRQQLREALEGMQEQEMVGTGDNGSGEVRGGGGIEEYGIPGYIPPSPALKNRRHR